MEEYIKKCDVILQIAKNKFSKPKNKAQINHNNTVDAVAYVIYNNIPTADVVERSKIDKAIEEIKEERAVISEEITNNNRQDLVNYKTALNLCLNILDRHINDKRGGAK